MLKSYIIKKINNNVEQFLISIFIENILDTSSVTKNILCAFFKPERISLYIYSKGPKICTALGKRLNRFWNFADFGSLKRNPYVWS